MSTVAIHLDPSLQHFVDESVSSGSFYSASEVVAVALRNLQADQETRASRLSALRQDVGLGLDQAARGEFVEFDAESIIAENAAR
ncbi:type II toxin-antitoxin system ParD family antitoxin [Roseimicrobium sp. ORNL1]|uniref:type II toxin-antitoxin system ParD family antitoxin n=1 Tax=Roseimicrobium sp. ORNL1 TaxID=2711231 RepID=UPI0013E1F2C2|nr:type II toxin-antitoxin system ParD family antitoxin [Roseimicrobium sp. ORNL1]QIF01389.1 type II toxin-antitoxin system ParD family antitoxin [Roseimicrobium sp. ORNL1]